MLLYCKCRCMTTINIKLEFNQEAKNCLPDQLSLLHMCVCVCTCMCTRAHAHVFLSACIGILVKDFSLTPSPPRCHSKTTHRILKSETLTPFCLFFFFFFFALACERIFIKVHSTERRCVKRLDVLFAGTSAHLSARKFYRLGQ